MAGRLVRVLAVAVLSAEAGAQSCANSACELCHASRGCTRHPSGACTWDTVAASCATVGGAGGGTPAPTPPGPAPAPPISRRRTPPPPPPPPASGGTTAGSAGTGTVIKIGDLGLDSHGRAVDSNEGADWMANGNTVDNYGVDHSLMNGLCTNLYDEPHGDGACANLISVGYRCRAYFCRDGSDFQVSAANVTRSLSNNCGNRLVVVVCARGCL